MVNSETLIVNFVKYLRYYCMLYDGNIHDFCNKLHPCHR